jgi:putative addiction module component (TIGR02574 family)
MYRTRILDTCGPAALGPYMLSMNVLVERFCFEIADSAGLGLPAIDIEKLAPEERLRLIGDLGGSLRAWPEIAPLTPLRRDELDHRLDELDQGNVALVSWDGVKRRLKGVAAHLVSRSQSRTRLRGLAPSVGTWVSSPSASSGSRITEPTT